MKRLEAIDKLMLTATDILVEAQCDLMPPIFPGDKDESSVFLRDWMSRSSYVWSTSDLNILNNRKEVFQKLLNHYTHVRNSAEEAYKWANAAYLALLEIKNAEFKQQEEEACRLVVQAAQLSEFASYLHNASGHALEMIEGKLKKKENSNAKNSK